MLLYNLSSTIASLLPLILLLGPRYDNLGILSADCSICVQSYVELNMGKGAQSLLQLDLVQTISQRHGKSVLGAHIDLLHNI
jgi:hypothetical protein